VQLASTVDTTAATRRRPPSSTKIGAPSSPRQGLTRPAGVAKLQHRCRSAGGDLDLPGAQQAPTRHPGVAGAEASGGERLPGQRFGSVVQRGGEDAADRHGEMKDREVVALAGLRVLGMQFDARGDAREAVQEVHFDQVRRWRTARRAAQAVRGGERGPAADEGRRAQRHVARADRQSDDPDFGRRRAERGVDHGRHQRRRKRGCGGGCEQQRGRRDSGRGSHRSLLYGPAAVGGVV
jgi:hypothetical protein